MTKNERTKEMASLMLNKKIFNLKALENRVLGSLRSFVLISTKHDSDYEDGIIGIYGRLRC